MQMQILASCVNILCLGKEANNKTEVALENGF